MGKEVWSELFREAIARAIRAVLEALKDFLVDAVIPYVQGKAEEYFCGSGFAPSST